MTRIGTLCTGAPSFREKIDDLGLLGSCTSSCCCCWVAGVFEAFAAELSSLGGRSSGGRHEAGGTSVVSAAVVDIFGVFCGSMQGVRVWVVSRQVPAPTP